MVEKGRKEKGAGGKGGIYGERGWKDERMRGRKGQDREMSRRERKEKGKGQEENTNQKEKVEWRMCGKEGKKGLVALFERGKGMKKLQKGTVLLTVYIYWL